jgi:hypothetical protein
LLARLELEDGTRTGEWINLDQLKRTREAFSPTH